MTICPHDQCGKDYQMLGIHWADNPSHRPTITQHQHDILTGLLMGDGCLFRKTAEPKMEVIMTCKEYLKYIHKKFGILGVGIRQESERTEDRKPIYAWATRTHHQLREYADWYGEDGKSYPKNTQMNKTILKHWYCCDGYFDNKNTCWRIRITVNNESGNKDKILSYFEGSNIVSPDVWDERETKNRGRACEIRWYKDSSKKLFEQLGKPLPGFEYKWPNGGED